MYAKQKDNDIIKLPNLEISKFDALAKLNRPFKAVLNIEKTLYNCYLVLQNSTFRRFMPWMSVQILITFSTSVILFVYILDYIA